MFEKRKTDKLNTSRKTVIRITALLAILGILAGSFLLPLSTKAQGDESKVVRVGWFDSAYCYKDQFGRRTGLAYEYQQKIAAYTGWTYEYVEGTWPELMQMLINGEIDLLSDVSYTMERSVKILYPRVPMGSESYYIFVKAGNDEMSLDDLSTFNGKVFAVDKGTIMKSLIKEWAGKYGIDIELKEFEDKSIDECFEMVDRGEVDAYVTIESYGNRKNTVPLCSIGSSDYYFGVSKKRPDLLKELNYALTSIQNEDPYYSQKLSQKYIWSANTNLYITAKEKAWLDAHGKIKVGYRDNYMPFCAEDNGKLIGALGDFLANASGVLANAEIEFVAIPYANTEHSLMALENGEVDVVFPINLSPHEMENMGLLGTEDFMRTEIYTVVKPGYKKDIFKDDTTKVALLAGNVNFDIFVQDHYPSWTIEHKPNLDECYKAVAQGEADCAMVNSYRINTNDRLRRRYNLSLLATGHDMDFSFAVKRENKELYSIMNKVITLTDESDTETNLSRYAGASEKVTFEDYIRDNAASAVAVAAVISSIILFLMLTKIRSDKKADDRQKLIAATELDELTKLYTRNFFFEYANRMHKEHPDDRLDAIVINIEQFHIINAINGWDFGDKVLKVLGDEIKAYLEENEGIACRSQADRFDIYCKHTDDHRAVYERFQRAYNNFSDNVNIRIRMGVMPYRPDLEPVEMFDRARTACNMVKGGHHVRLMVFDEEMREREILEQNLLNDLKYAVDHNEFLVYYQPKYNVQLQPPVLQSAEALVRWKHHDFGMISPGVFISLFEKNGLIDAVDKYVWREAARQIAEWKKKYGRTIPVSVNMSRVEIFDPNLMQTLEEIIEKNGLDRTDLHIEVTESAYTEDTDQIIGIVSDLRNMGYIIEMDDFGTGYSSLNMLSSMPVDVLKLDKSFIDNIDKTDDSEDRDVRLVELLLDIAKSLKLTVVAEGVENEKQVKFLKERGCDMIQGYFFAPPLPADEFEKRAFGETLSE